MNYEQIEAGHALASKMTALFRNMVQIEARPRPQPVSPEDARALLWELFCAFEDNTAASLGDYLDPDDAEDQHRIAEVYDQFRIELLQQFFFLRRQGVTVEFTADDPYKNAKDMFQRFGQTVLDGAPRLLVLRTKDEDMQDHAWLAEQPGAGLPLTLMTNDIFRAVHDFYGHLAGRSNFYPVGEFIAFRHHASMFSRKALPALVSETVQQTAHWAVHKTFMSQKPRVIRNFDAWERMLCH